MKTLFLTICAFGLTALFASADNPAEVTNSTGSAKSSKQLGVPSNFLKGAEIIVEGVVVTQPEKRILPVELKNKMQPEMSLRELMAEFGNGWLSPFSGIGNIQWFFEDGTVLSVGPPPLTLDQKKTVRESKEDGK